MHRLVPGERVALALALAASALAAALLALSLTGAAPAGLLDVVFAAVAAVAGAGCLGAWRSGDSADRGRRPLRALGAMLLAVAAFTLAPVVGDAPWRELLEVVGVLIVAALVATLRRTP